MNKPTLLLQACALILALLFQSSLAFAAAPETLTYAGKLAQDGEAFDGSADVTFELYDAETGGQAVWSEAFDQLDVSDGRFIVELGATNPIAETLDGNRFWLEVSVNGQALSPRSAVGSVPYAIKAGDAQTVGGMDAAQLSDTRDLEERIADLESRLASAEGNVSTLQTDVAANTVSSSKNATRIDALQTDVSALQMRASGTATAISGLQTDVSALRADVDAVLMAVMSLAKQVDLDALTTRVVELETKTASMSAQTIGGKAAVVFDAVNLHIRNGQGATNGDPADPAKVAGVQVNGLGNLIVGYDEARDTGSDKSGSHNLVVGIHHNYPSFGALVVGRENTVSNAYTSVSGGRENTASGFYASVSGGNQNTASDFDASVCGGRDNTASGVASSVSGGFQNIASGSLSSISGGQENDANAGFTSISGGFRNTASGDRSSVSGGSSNIASGPTSSVSGGTNNTASAGNASVSGGQENTASGLSSSVSGGFRNTANGIQSSVSGGGSRSVTGFADWRAGDLFETN